MVGDASAEIVATVADGRRCGQDRSRGQGRGVMAAAAEANAVDEVVAAAKVVAVFQVGTVDDLCGRGRGQGHGWQSLRSWLALWPKTLSLLRPAQRSWPRTRWRPRSGRGQV